MDKKKEITQELYTDVEDRRQEPMIDCRPMSPNHNEITKHESHIQASYYSRGPANNVYVYG